MSKLKYNYYKAVITPKTSVVTPFQADVIFGHICWAIKYLKSNNELEAFLKEYENEPPLLLSDGLPEGYFPKPNLKPLSIEENEEVINSKNSKEIMRGINILKKYKKIKFIKSDYFKNKKINRKEIVKDFFNEQLNKKLNMFYDDSLKCNKSAIYKTPIDRYMNKAIEGRLFFTEEIFYAPEIKLEVFIKSIYDKTWFDDIFEYMNLSGYGADKSSGKGNLNINLIPFENDSLPHSITPNSFLSLSGYIPDKSDPTVGFYSTYLKYGKLGEEYSVKPFQLNGTAFPFKCPLVFLGNGAVFKHKENEAKHYYGKMIQNNIHRFSNIKQYAYSYPLHVEVTDD